VRDIAELKGKEHAVQLYQSGLAALLELSRMNNSPVPNLIRFVLEQCVEITESRAGTLALLGEEERHIVSDASVGPVELTSAVKEKSWPPPRGPILVNSAGKTSLAGGAHVLRMLSVPLVQDNRVVCILKVMNKETDYGDADIHRVRLLLDGLWRHIREQNFQEEFLKSQKMESLSLLAGNMGNDFNNLLTGIVGNLDLAKLYTDPNSIPFQLLEEAEAATVRAQHLTHQLMTFARCSSPQRRVVSLREILSEAAHFVLRGSTVKPVLLLPETLWPTLGDEGQISQVIHNLLLNALQAMPDGGTVWVQGENVTVGPGSIIPVTPGQYVRFSVRDSGPGIREEIRTQIFDPYFTTRDKA
ncbi:MAG: ATP-binding protein, partial [Thermodesulfobacteriota bacterium]